MIVTYCRKRTVGENTVCGILWYRRGSGRWRGRPTSALVDLVYCYPLVTGSKPNTKSTPAKDSLCL